MAQLGSPDHIRTNPPMDSGTPMVCIDIQDILDPNAWVHLSNMRKEAEDLDEKKLAEAVEQAKKKRILRRFFFVFGDRWKPPVGSDAPNGW